MVYQASHVRVHVHDVRLHVRQTPRRLLIITAAFTAYSSRRRKILMSRLVLVVVFVVVVDARTESAMNRC